MNQGIIKRLNKTNHKESSNLFFQLIVKLLEKLQINQDSSKIVSTCRNDHTKMIGLSIGRRRLLQLNEDGSIGLYIEDQYYEDLKNSGINYLKKKFSGQPSANTILVSFEEYHLNRQQLLNWWLSSCSLYYELGHKTPYSKHHNPEILRMAFDNAFLQEYLTNAGVVSGLNPNLLGLIEEYKTLLNSGALTQEDYKWKLLEEYQGKPNLKAEDFKEEFLSINYDNLVYHDVKTVWQTLCNNAPDEYRELLTELFNESEDLEGRIKKFHSKTEVLFHKIQPNAKHNHHHDERTIGSLLAFKYPDKYPLYKWSFFDKYWDLFHENLGILLPKPAKWEQYPQYQSMINYLVEIYVKRDNELLELVKSKLPEGAYKDPNFLLLGQDILYQCLDKYAVKGLMASDTTGWQDNYIERMKTHSHGVIWNSKKPSGTDDVLRQLQCQIDLNGAFPIYYTVNGMVRYRANVIEYVKDEKTFNKAKWDSKFDSILDFHASFNEYKDANKSASVVFLIDKLERLELDLPRERFKMYRNYQYPTQDNFQPIGKIFNSNPIKTNLKSENDMSKTKNVESMPLNQILYGPPGTGKTFKLKNEYFNLFVEENNKVSFDVFIGNIINELTWWETIALVLLSSERQTVPEIKKHKYFRLKEAVSNNKNSNSAAWVALQSHTELKSETVNFTNRMFPLVFRKEEDSHWLVIPEIIERDAPHLFDIQQEIDDFSPARINSINYEFTTFHQSFAYEDFIEGIRPTISSDKETSGEVSYEIEKGIFYRIADKAAQKAGFINLADCINNYSTIERKERFSNAPKCALFIDEINRGNVSQIFGELITLIEEDKRLGANQELIVSLPYSKKDKFGVPPNLFVIGTMNTADRSVEALDSALRRRFSFKEVLPNPTINELNYSAFGYSVSNLLSTINSRIEKLLDKDHLIGHSFFIRKKLNNSDKQETGEACLMRALQSNIIPLLQEYFFGDFGKIGLILGEGFVKRKENNHTLFADFNYDGSGDFDDREIFEITNYDTSQLNEFKIAIKLLLNIKDDATKKQ